MDKTLVVASPGAFLEAVLEQGQAPLCSGTVCGSALQGSPALRERVQLQTVVKGKEQAE